MYKRQVLETTEKIVNRDKLTTLMITHNMKAAIVHGNRLIMLKDGHVLSLIHILMEKKCVEPAGIIGVPVGFVNVVEAKELILEKKEEVPCIVARGRKGEMCIRDRNRTAERLVL